MANRGYFPKTLKYSIVTSNNCEEGKKAFMTFRTKKEAERSFNRYINGYAKHTSLYATVIREGYALITGASGFEEEAWIEKNF